MQETPTSAQLRTFGLTGAAIAAGFAVWPFFAGNGEPSPWMLAAGGGIAVTALASPRHLAGLYRGWMAIGHVLGWVNTRILLGAIFYLVVTPLGVARRWQGTDPMGRRRRPDLATYRVTRPARPPSHLKRQY
jgi:hypothetical protein